MPTPSSSMIIQTETPSDISDTVWEFMTSVKSVRKRDGSEQGFDHTKLQRSLEAAIGASGISASVRTRKLEGQVLTRLKRQFDGHTIPATSDIREVVSSTLIDNNLTHVAKRYLDYHLHQASHASLEPRYGHGITVERFFTKPDQHPYDEITWELRDAVITDAKGNIVFEQKNVEVPNFWSQTATNIVVSKYFFGTIGKEDREYSVKQLVKRVAKTMADWGRVGGYFQTALDAQTFEDELHYILVNQMAAFNSPVWFNVGTPRPQQCSACFINSVQDDMRSILGLCLTEGILFKGGSGTGTNLSKLRSKFEYLSGSNGKASGPVSFMKGLDSFAGVIKSGGKTRRAAKMVILDVSHPDVEDFITCKVEEEKKAWALMDAGYDGAIDGAAYASVYFQNANHSVRVTDEFMQAVEADGDWSTRAVTTGEPVETKKARQLFRTMADAAWHCGDPGIQYDTTVNRWHTCKNTDRIYASNPCVTGDTLIATSKGYRRMVDLVGAEADVIAHDGGISHVTNIFPTGQKEIYELRTRSGYTLRLTADHKVWTANRDDVPACELCAGDVLELGQPGFGQEEIEEVVAEMIGLAVGDGCLTRDEQETVATGIRLGTSSRAIVEPLKTYAVLDQGSEKKQFTDAVFSLNKQNQAALLRGLFTADGTVADYGLKSQYVALDSTSLTLLRQVQLMLLGFGIKAKIYENRRTEFHATFPNGRGGSKEYPVQQMHSLRVSRDSRVFFETQIGFLHHSPKQSTLENLNRSVQTYTDQLFDEFETLTFIGTEDVYDLTEPRTHHFVANGLVVHNCSEYMFLDDSACNLASLNLMRFRKETNGEMLFDIEAFKAANEIIITAMEIVVGSSVYPTPAIEQNSFDYRPLGIGYANLGALIMSSGFAYDSDEGRNLAATISSLQSGHCYYQSAKIAEKIGPFAGFHKNAEPCMEVMRMHRDAAYRISSVGVSEALLNEARASWDRVVEHGTKFGLRNAQISVIAPTGTISFLMDCDTTGVEPDIALVKYKWLVGGGMIKIVNKTVPEALARLGYRESERNEILSYIEEHDTIEGAPHLKKEHLAVFDCAFKPAKGTRSIQYMGHVRMMAAVQPFISGAISKTVNMPFDATNEDIERVYVEGWKMGLKAIAIYRDGSKRQQALTTSKEQDAKKQNEGKMEDRKLRRRRLPDERRSITHKFAVGSHEGYITVGLYDDGVPGELFVTMSKEGSVISGLMDSFATAVSIGLQYGVPLDVLVNKFVHTRFEPSGYTNNPQIRIAKSIVDYIFRWLAMKFLPREVQISVGINVTQEETTEPPELFVEKKSETPNPPPSNQFSFFDTTQKTTVSTPVLTATFDNQADAPACDICGSMMVRNASCYKCLNCGATSGCS